MCVCPLAAHSSSASLCFPWAWLGFSTKSLDPLALKTGLSLSVLWANRLHSRKWMPCDDSHCVYEVFTLCTHFPLPCLGHCCYSVCGSLVSKLIRICLRAWGRMNALFPLLPQYDVFPFLCVFWSLSCGQAVLWWGAGLSGAPVLFLAAAAVGGCWGERRQKGISWSPKNQRLFKGFLSGGIAL